MDHTEQEQSNELAETSRFADDVTDELLLRAAGIAVEGPMTNFPCTR